MSYSIKEITDPKDLETLRSNLKRLFEQQKSALGCSTRVPPYPSLGYLKRNFNTTRLFEVYSPPTRDHPDGLFKGAVHMGDEGEIIAFWFKEVDFVDFWDEVKILIGRAVGHKVWGTPPPDFDIEWLNRMIPHWNTVNADYGEDGKPKRIWAEDDLD